MKVPTQKKYQDHLPCSFAYKVVCVDENSSYEFIKAILKDYTYSRKVLNKHFNKNLIMNEEEEHLFQQSNSCWICKNLIDNDEQKVRSLSRNWKIWRRCTLEL